MLHLRYITNTLQLKVALEPWAWQADFPRLRNDYQREKAGLSCALLPPYKLIISPSICFFSLHSHNGVTFSIFSRALLVRAALASRPLQIGMASISNQTNTKTSQNTNTNTLLLRPHLCIVQASISDQTITNLYFRLRFWAL